MKENFYGVAGQTKVDSDIDRYAEEIAVRGFTVISGVLPDADLPEWRKKIDTIYAKQEADFGHEALAAIQEVDVCRAPLLYDEDFLKLVAQPLVLDIVRRFLGDWHILNLQNAVVNRPHVPHHQSSWHRDLPHQNWVISKPLAINVLWIIDEFSDRTGGTHVLPFSHRAENLPSAAYIEANRAVVNAPAGSAVVFDAMLFHRAGANKSDMIRRAVNQLYTIPILKQQYDFPQALGARPHMDPAMARLLGYTSQVPLNDLVWRRARAEKLATTK